METTRGPPTRTLKNTELTGGENIQKREIERVRERERAVELNILSEKKKEEDTRQASSHRHNIEGTDDLTTNMRLIFFFTIINHYLL